MRWLGVLVAAVLLSACSALPFGGDDDDTGATGSFTADDPPSPTDAAVCESVRAGIDAFNDSDFDETVSQFREAVPLAEEFVARTDGAADEDASEVAGLLLEAVEYYAALPAEEYLEASASSPDFERWKQVTLGLCVVPGEQGAPEPPGVET